MVFFTTPELLEIGNVPFVTLYEKPTRIEALRYYRRVVEAFELPRSKMGQTVTSVRREDGSLRSWRRTTDQAESPALGGAHRGHCHRGLRPAEPHGRPWPGPAARVATITRRPNAYFRKNVVIVGGANSTADAALENVSRRGQGDDRAPWRGPGTKA